MERCVFTRLISCVAFTSSSIRLSCIFQMNFRSPLVSSSLMLGGSCMSIWMSACDGEMITLNEFLFLYRLKAFTYYGYFELLPWTKKSRIVRSFPSSFHDWKSRYFFISGTAWETLFDDFWGEVPRLLRKWEVPALGAYFHCPLLFFFHVLIARLMTFSF